MPAQIACQYYIICKIKQTNHKWCRAKYAGDCFWFLVFKVNFLSNNNYFIVYNSVKINQSNNLNVSHARYIKTMLRIAIYFSLIIFLMFLLNEIFILGLLFSIYQKSCKGLQQKNSLNVKVKNKYLCKKKFNVQFCVN